MENKEIIIDGLSCDNCPEFKRCQEQQTKKEYAINQVLQDIPSEYANIIDRLKQIIPSITRCDYVLEKQLSRKEQECQQTMDNYVQLDLQRVKEYNELVDLYKAKEQECEGLKNIINEAKNSDKKTLKIIQTLTEIKEIMKKYCKKCKKHKFYNFKLCITCKYTDILQKISECEVENDT